MNLQDFLTKTGITQSAFSKMVGLSQPFIAQIIMGHEKAGIKTAMRIQEITKGQVTIADVRPDLSGLKLNTES
jgi:DNA-binding transcriptional regulator YdaS (Cro superfamily)